VLIVDDDPHMAAAMRRAFQRHGFSAVVATNARDARVFAAAQQPTLITLDLCMPGFGGLDVLRFLRQEPAMAAVRILVVSGAPRAALSAARNAGADDVLEKPFSNRDLIEKATHLMESPRDPRTDCQETETRR